MKNRSTIFAAILLALAHSGRRKTDQFSRRRAMKTAMRLVVAIGLLIPGPFLQAGTFADLHDFTGAPGDGAFPHGLILGSDGNFYGTTNEGGAHDGGCVFKMDSAGTLTLLHSF